MTKGIKHGLLLRIERFSRQRYKLVFLSTLILVLLASWAGSKLKLESDILNLFPAHNERVSAFKSAVIDFGSIDYLIALIETEGVGTVDDIEEFADRFAERLTAETELIEKVEYKLELDERFLDLFYDHALLYLDPAVLPELHAKLSDEGIRDQLADAKRSMSAPTADFAEGLLLNDPLNLMPLFIERLMKNRGAFDVDLADGYYLSKDNQSLLMLIKPTGHSQDLDFDKLLMSMIDRAEEEVTEELAVDRAEYDEPPAGVSVAYTGNYAIAIDEAKLVREDVSFNLIASVLAVSLLYWICYRRFAALIYSVLPLAVGQALTFAVAYYMLHQLNASSSAFTALLMGLGTDFTIVMYARYVEERRAGKSLAEATELMVGETGLGVFTGAITSAGTFYAMCVSRFRGLFDLGFLIGTGILLCAVAILFLLPAMITWNEGVRRRKVDSVKKLHLQSFGLEHLMTLAARYPKAMIAAVLALTAVAGAFALQLEFDDSIKSLRSNKSPAFQVQQQIGETFGASLSYMMAVSRGDTFEEALERARQVEDRLQPFVEDGTVGSYDAVLTYLPPESRQREILRAIENGRDDLFNVERIRGAFLAGLEEQGFVEEAFDEYLQRMDRFLQPERPLVYEDLEERGLGDLLRRYVRKDETGVRIVSYLFPTDPRWKREPPPGLIDALRQDDPDIVVTGTNVISQELRAVFRSDAPRGVMIGLAIVFVLLLVDFRSLKLTLIALAQLICGVIIMLGGIYLIGWQLNFANAFVATMILGVGIDYSIHLVHRMNMNGGLVDDGTLETGKAVVLAALTNIAGFGTLAFGNYPALKSFGLVASIGSLACLITALTLVPALMSRPGVAEGER